jgi:hypothetical protein
VIENSDRKEVFQLMEKRSKTSLTLLLGYTGLYPLWAADEVTVSVLIVKLLSYMLLPIFTE